MWVGGGCGGRGGWIYGWMDIVLGGVCVFVGRRSRIVTSGDRCS